jgi:hypothetical protein
VCCPMDDRVRSRVVPSFCISLLSLILQYTAQCSLIMFSLLRWSGKMNKLSISSNAPAPITLSLLNHPTVGT